MTTLVDETTFEKILREVIRKGGDLSQLEFYISTASAQVIDTGNANEYSKPGTPQKEEQILPSLLK